MDGHSPFVHSPVYEWFNSLIVPAVEDLILDILDEWEDEFRAYSSSNERLFRGLPYPYYMVQYLLTLHPPGHSRPSVEPFGRPSAFVNQTSVDPLAIAVPPLVPVDDATLQHSHRSRPTSNSRNGQVPGKSVRYRYDMGGRQNTVRFHDDGTDSAFCSARRMTTGGYS